MIFKHTMLLYYECKTPTTKKVLIEWIAKGSYYSSFKTKKYNGYFPCMFFLFLYSRLLINPKLVSVYVKQWIVS